MIYALAVPEFVEDVKDVRVLQWNADIGRQIMPGELIVELETYKALVEVRAGQAGVLRRILSAEGNWMSVGQPLALMSDTDEEPLPDTAEGLTRLDVKFEVS